MNDRIRTAFSEIRTDKALIDNTATYLQKELENRRSRNKTSILPRFAGALASIAVVIVGVFAYSLYFTADAYLSIDVNPSMELTLNRFDKVIATHAFNNDGGRILDKVGLRGKSYDEATGLIISHIGAEGYFSDDALISVIVRTENGEREQLLCSALRRLIAEQISSVESGADIEIFPVSADIWCNAHECNISPAKYMAIQELLEVDEKATIEAYSDSSICQIRQRAQECRNAYNCKQNDDIPSTPADKQGQGYCNGNGHKGER